jgi:hypothetical protein
MTYIHSVGRSSYWRRKASGAQKLAFAIPSRGAKKGLYSLFGLGLIMAALALFPLSAAYAHDEGSNKSGTKVEVNLNGDGSALVRGAKVTAVSGSTISATTNYGSSQLAWTVKTDGNTKFNANKGSSTGLANIAVGDTVSFSGSLDQSVSGLTVNAKVVKDWNHVESKKTLSGIVTSINTTLNSFTLSHDNATTSVQTNSATDFDLSNGGDGTFASIFLNAKVKVQGLFNASSSVLTATKIHIATTTNSHDWDNDDRKEWRNWIKSKVWLNW